MGSPLRKYAEEAAQGLFFGRVDQDGLPFEGEPRPRRDHEYDEMAVVRSFHHKFFMLDSVDDMKEYDDVMDKVYNSWYEQKCIQRFVTLNGKLCHYLEWCIPKLSDGQPYRPNDLDARIL